jgi:hypothetical protein
VAVGGAVDGPVRLDGDLLAKRRRRRQVGAGGSAVLADQAAAALCVLLARNLSPSSSVRW